MLFCVFVRINIALFFQVFFSNLKCQRTNSISIEALLTLVFTLCIINRLLSTAAV